MANTEQTLFMDVLAPKANDTLHYTTLRMNYANGDDVSSFIILAKTEEVERMRKAGLVIALSDMDLPLPLETITSTTHVFTYNPPKK